MYYNHLLLLLSSFPYFVHSAGDDKLCHVCRSTTIEVDKALTTTGSKRGESDVMDVLQDICKFDSFKVYDYPPPKMVSMCKKVMDSHEETFELKFQDKSLNVDALQNEICASFCEGIDVTKKRAPEQPQVFMDGEPLDTDRVQVPKASYAPGTGTGLFKYKHAIQLVPGEKYVLSGYFKMKSYVAGSSSGSYFYLRLCKKSKQPLGKIRLEYCGIILEAIDQVLKIKALPPDVNVD